MSITHARAPAQTVGDADMHEARLPAGSCTIRLPCLPLPQLQMRQVTVETLAEPLQARVRAQAEQVLHHHNPGKHTG